MSPNRQVDRNMNKRPYHCISIGVVAAIMLAGCSSPADREARALKRGNEYFAAGNYEKARVEYRNALQAVPNDAEARYRNGLVLEKMGEVREAAQFYLGATEAEPKYEVARKALARLLVAGHATNDALDVLEVGLDQKPHDGMYLSLRAAAKMQLEDHTDAREDAEAGFNAAPDNEYVVAILAGILRSEGDVSKARAVLESGVRTVKDSVDLRMALVSLEGDAGNVGQAEHWMREVVAMRPKDASYRVTLAQFLAKAGRTDAAEKEIRDARKLFPDNVGVRSGLVQFLIANRGAAAAEAELRRDADAKPNDDESRLLLGAFLADTGSADAATTELSKVIHHAGTTAPGLSARSRLAAIALSRGKVAEGEKLVSEVLAKSPRDTDALVVRGSLRLQQGNAAGAVEDLRAASRDVPNSVPVLLSLAEAHAAVGEVGLAEEAFRRAVEIGGADSSPRLMLAQFLLSQGRPTEARDILAPTFRSTGDDQVIEETTLRAALGAHDHALAQEVIAKVRGGSGGSARASFYAGLAAVAEGHREEAIKHYMESVRQDPKGQSALAEATKLLNSFNRRAEALKLLDETSAKTPASGYPELLKGDTLLSARELGQAEAAYREALRRQPRLAEAHRGMAYVLLGRGNFDGAVKALVDSAPKTDDPHLLLVSAGELLQLAGKKEGAIERYQAALKLQPNDLLLRANLALLTLSAHDDSAGRKQAGELVNGFAESANPRLRDSYAFVELKSGDAAGALRILERLAKDAPTNPLIHYHLGAAQAELGNREVARAALKIATASPQRFIGDDDARQMLEKLVTAK